MKVFHGLLKRVGAKEGDMWVNSNANSNVGTVRVSGKVSVIEIGDDMLRNVGCTRDLYDLLDPGEVATLYVHYHFFRTPVVLAVGYAGKRTYKQSWGTIIAGALQYLIIYPLLTLVAGLVSTMFLGNFLGMLLIVAGLGLCAYNAFTLVSGFSKIPDAT